MPDPTTPNPRFKLEGLLASEFVTKAHVNPAQAQSLSQWLVDSTIISAHLASHATPPPNIPMSPQQARLEAFKNILSERALEEFFNETPAVGTDRTAAHEIIMASNAYNYEQLYQAAQQVPLPPLSEGNQLHPFVSYIFETGSGKFKHEAGSLALKKFAGTESGQKVVKAALNNPVTKEAAKKLLTQLGVKAATTAATAGSGAAAGAEAGAAAGSPGGPLAIVTAIVGAVVGFVLGAVVGNWSKAKHEAQEGILALSAAVYSVGSAIFSGGVAAVGAIFAAVGSVAVSSATSLVVIILAIPIVVAFFLYIVNNSAYLVPPGGTPFSGGLAGLPPGAPCSSNSTFINFLPNPIPTSYYKGIQIFGSYVFPRLPQVSSVYGQASQVTGVPCEVFAGIHYIEGGNDPNKSLVSGRRIGSVEPDVRTCNNPPVPPGQPYWDAAQGGCVFSSLIDTAIYAGNLLKAKVGGNLISYPKLVNALSYYNGGGNRNCGQVPKTQYELAGNCPPLFIGEDDPYAMSFLDNKHSNMNLIYCADRTRCAFPYPSFNRAGSYTIAYLYYKSLNP